MADQWIRVLADDRQWEELSGRKFPAHIGLRRIDRYTVSAADESILADIILQELAPDMVFPNGHAPSHPVFVNAVVHTLDRYPEPDAIVRMNGWPGFINAATWELSAHEATRPAVDMVMAALDWPFVWVADIPGLLTPRVVSMIISEARLALAEGVATSDDIDTAMKLGTNYPYGPFEWEARIGPDRVAALLDAMAAQDDLYAESRITPTSLHP